MRTLPVCCVLIALLACGGEPAKPPQSPKLGDVLPTILMPPDGELVSRSGGTEAISLQFHTRHSPDSVAAYYRKVFSKAPWRLVGDSKTQDGGIALYAQQIGPPLWVTIKKLDGAAGTEVDLVGAKDQ